jgi:hypothetical protein
MKIKIISLLSFAILLNISSTGYALTGADAFVGYRVCCEQKTSGIYPDDDFVYFVSEIEMNNKRLKRIAYEGKSMLQFNQQLVEYVTRDMLLIDDSNIAYKGNLGLKIKQSIQESQHINIDVDSLRTHILVNDSERKESGERVYRYVVAIPSKELNKKKNTIHQKLNHIDNVVHQVFLQAKQAERYQDLVGWYLELGLFEDALYYQKQLLSQELYLVNYYQQDNPFHEREVLRNIVSQKIDLNPALLKQSPANTEIITWLINEQYQDNPMASIVLMMTMLVDNSKINQEKILNNINEQLLRLGEQYPFVLDYIKLQKNINQIRNKSDSIFQNNSILRMVLATSGHLMMDDQLPKYETNEFKQAERLFKEGVEPEKIITLLLNSIKKSPRHIKSWDYLSAVFWAKDMKLEALVVYTQLYQLDNNSLETMESLEKSYSSVDLQNMADKYGTHIAIINK